MARGNVVLDENLKDIKAGLQAKNLRVFEAPAGIEDEIVAALASGRILIANNTKDFRQAAIEHEFGIIATEGCVPECQRFGCTNLSRDHRALTLESARSFHSLACRKQTREPVRVM